jgi:CDP-glycerol glycerophosphotransferase (TagB/SpsB family)
MNSKKSLCLISSDPYNPVILQLLDKLSTKFNIKIITDVDIDMNYPYEIYFFKHKYTLVQSFILLFRNITSSIQEQKFRERNVYRKYRNLINILFTIKKFFSKYIGLPSYSQITYFLFKNFKSHDKFLDSNDIFLTDANLRHTLFLNPLIARVASINKPLFSMVYSWDNPQYATLNSFSDKYFVWNEINKEELIRFYQIEKEKILISGGLILDYLQDKSAKNISVVNSHTNDENIKILYPCVFGAQDQPMLIEEINFLKNLYKDLEKNIQNFTLIVRTYPSINEKDFYNELMAYKNLTFYRHKNYKTIPRLGNKKETISFSSNQEKIDSLNISDILISNGSTMTLEYSYLNKPIIHLNANEFEKGKINKVLFNRLSIYGHLQHLCPQNFNLNVVSSFDGIIEGIKKYKLKEMLSYNSYLKEFCNPTKELASNNIMNNLINPKNIVE